jgi:hypothetical protein
MLNKLLNAVKTQLGKNLISIILGIGLASIFRKACENERCLVFKAPSVNSIKNNIYQHDNSCFKFNERSVNCDSKKKKVTFA